MIYQFASHTVRRWNSHGIVTIVYVYNNCSVLAGVSYLRCLVLAGARNSDIVYSPVVIVIATLSKAETDIELVTVLQTI